MPNPLSQTLGTREVERFLSGFHDIADGQRSAYAGRIKHLTRGGFPPGIAGRPGVPAWYDADRLFQMLVVTALWQLGVSPARSMALVLEAWPRLKKDVLGVWLAVDASQRSGSLDVPPIFWRVPVEALRHMARPDRDYSPDSEDRIDAMTAEDAHAALDKRGYGLRGSAFIKADQLIQDALRQLGYQLGGHAELAMFMRSLIPPPTIEV